MKDSTKVITSGRDKKWTQGLVNVPVSRASTIVFDSVNEKNDTTKNLDDYKLFYGRRGTNTHFAFQEAIRELENASGSTLFPCGTSAITQSILSFVKTGQHILLPDAVYEPTRDFCNVILNNLGVSVTYYPSLVSDDIESYIKENTTLLFLESPSSLTMEIQDISKLVKVAQKYKLITMIDNTWATPLFFKPLDFGIDISIHSATKYIVGHSDVMMGVASANKKHWNKLKHHAYLLGNCVSPDDVYLAARGLRTLHVRLKQHEASALIIAKWLSKRKEVKKVYHPALKSALGHENFVKYFSGSSGLFSFELMDEYKDKIHFFVDALSLFKIGYSWGGYESLVLPITDFSKIRVNSSSYIPNNLIRLHIGLENIKDLEADLENAFNVMNKTAKPYN
ncbi:cystathionine beta-lyase [Paraphotobacterium marinum]|uniref:Cystathionine beta-lyase n=1 Tax=Paraphotobacterium marinum TaxID=1755811 RepID=A0A220VGX5_9GAMM|nr:cystathionine beta-lyase [Paraphotobacterium marinum]ASK79496.1 cystathionine beta-lyase [Paraphotobacterium marinum]